MRREREQRLTASLEFDTEFTSEAPMDSVVEDSHLSASVQANFQGFTYVQPAGMMGESVR